jgi:heme exporter protein CcmD
MSGMGVIEGGWEFVWTAYGISAAVLLGYAASLVRRLRSVQARPLREAGRASDVL